jgi:hypothetical protein
MASGEENSRSALGFRFHEVNRSPLWLYFCRLLAAGADNGGRQLAEAMEIILLDEFRNAVQPGHKKAECSQLNIRLLYFLCGAPAFFTMEVLATLQRQLPFSQRDGFARCVAQESCATYSG